jgi:hypothetical protein
MLNQPGVTLTKRGEPRKKTFTPLPPTVARYAPQMLWCDTCYTKRLADPHGVLLWHQVMKGDGSGQRYECAGVGSIGLEVPKSTTQSPEK